MNKCKYNFSTCIFQHNKAADSKLPCGFVPSDGQELNVRSIRPSTMFFTMGHSDVQPDSLHVAGRHLHRVCYSFHSSYSEVRDIVMYLKPKRIVPNVKPAPDKHIREVREWIRTTAIFILFKSYLLSTSGKISSLASYKITHYIFSLSDSPAFLVMWLIGTIIEQNIW